MRSLPALGFVAATGSVLALAGCGSHKSKLDLDRGADVDAMWDLAPDDTQLGLVASPRAVGLAFRGVSAIRDLSAQADLEPAKPQIDMIVKGIFGSETGTAADAGFSDKLGFAMFATSDGVLGVMPVVDRDKFMATKHGTRGTGSNAEDTLEGNTCRELRGHYVCASRPEMFDRLGKGSLRGKVKAGERGDAELFMKNVSLLGEAKGDLAAAVLLDVGTVDLRARWTGTPSAPLSDLVNVVAPHPSTSSASGFVTFDAKPMLAALPPIPVAGGVTLDQLSASMTGPVTAVIPSGSVDIQIHAPLTDPKPAQTIIEHCTDIGNFFELAKTQTPGACRILLQGTSQLELDIWVEGNELRFGAHKGAAPQGKEGGMTSTGSAIASGDWTAAFWGRGTMLNLAGIAPATTDVPTEVALGIHAIALVNELGAAAKVDPQGVTFRAYLRTAWTNPPDVFAKIAAITGNEIVTGKATEPAKAIAAASPSSPFAADFAAGQGGLMIPAAAIGVASAVVIPAVLQAVSNTRGDAEAAQQPDMPPMNNDDLAKLLTRAYVEEAYPQYKQEHPDKPCPDKLEDLAKYFGENPGVPVLEDGWGHPLKMTCDPMIGLVVISLGPDGQFGTADDVQAP
ncbi:MAG TPA: hypothetical protein VL326_18350 [Kofleriaceae bacterium]|nr:hypothetical protein [Kofleriaceae bacterium]